MSSTAAEAAQRPLDELARRLTKRSSIAKVTEGREVEPGSGEEALDEAGLVLHPSEPGLREGGELGEVALGERLASDRLRWDQTDSTGFSSEA